MHSLDITLIIIYALLLIGIAIKCALENKDSADYYLGGKKIHGIHIGLSVAATDVGGGFSIGLGALGFSMGISGSWLLFTGLVGALWSSAILIPFLKKLERKKIFFSYPQVISERYGSSAAKVAAIISIIGYLGFTSSQLLAGTKLTEVLFPEYSRQSILLILAFVTVLYTSLGGLKAVIYTDSVQWTIVLIGLSCFAIPFAVGKIGGVQAVIEHLPPAHLSISNISWKTFLNWMVSIIPIWFVAMTLYQRIFACQDERTAKKAWLTAGLFEWPIMAFLGATLGLIAKSAAEAGLLSDFSSQLQNDSELAIPVLLKDVLPVGVLGIVFAAYISAVLSTADSCLMAASGNLFTDILKRDEKKRSKIFNSTVITLLLGILAYLIATFFNNILQLMLYSYSFMISGLFIPSLAMIYLKKHSQWAAIASMLAGGLTCVLIGDQGPWGLDANIYGILSSLIVYSLFHLSSSSLKKAK